LVRKKKQTNVSGRSLITHNNPLSPISEQFRTIRTNLQFASIDGDLRTIMVTSSSPAEGKSTTTANLAVVYAQQGKKVLLVDADLRKPTIHYTFKVDNRTGLTNILTGQNSLEDSVASSNIENLDLLSSGPIPPNPAELLGSQSMERFMEEAKNMYDVVVFDTPPVLAVTDGQILANRCDGVMLVIKSKYTEVEAAQKAKELLNNANAKLLGVVLNHKELKESNYYYYYGTN